MGRNLNFLLFFILLTGLSATAQSLKVIGKITNSKIEPIAFASVQVKEYKEGTVTNEDGNYELELEEGKYELVISMIGYKVQVITIILQKTNLRQDVILEAADATTLSTVTIKGK